jgi:hypothetical protein
MKRCIKVLLAVCVLALMIGQAFADQVIEKRVAADTPEKFQQIAADIRKDMSQGGRYEFMRPDEKAKAEDDMSAILKMLQDAGSVAAMKRDQQMRLFNVQENLNGLLTHNDRNRLVCEKNAAVGTHIQTTTCKTVGDIERERASSRKYMADQSEKQQIPLSNKAPGPNN